MRGLYLQHRDTAARYQRHGHTVGQRGRRARRAPAEGEPVSFATHIKPLFRARDRQSMTFAFDLWSRDDGAAHADAILDRLSAGSMLCDGAWPADRAETFRRWPTSGRLARLRW